MTTIVNGRWIQSYAINRAVLDAFHTFLPIGRYPIAVINVEGDPFLTDVNVHPSKQQIRMSKEGELLTLIKESIHKAIQKNVIVPEVTKKETVRQKPSEQVRFWESPPRQEPPTEKFSTPVQQPVNTPSPLYEKVEQTTQESNWAVNEPLPKNEVTESEDEPRPDVISDSYFLLDKCMERILLLKMKTVFL